MGRICRVPSCQSNFPASRAKNLALKLKNDVKNSQRTNINTFGLPKNAEERLRWIKAIPRINPSIIDEKKKAFVCEKHWPAGFERIKGRNGKFRPKDPPSIFTGFKPSEIPTPPPPPRTTKKSSFTVRSREEDQWNAFIDADQVTFEELESKVTTRTFCAPVVSCKTGNILWIQSAEFLSGTPSFAIQIYQDLTFEAFHTGAKVFEKKSH